MDFSASSMAARRIFGAALELAPGDRRSFLARECGEDSALEAEVKALLETHARAGRFLDPDKSDREDKESDSDNQARIDRLRWLLLDEQPGSVIDRYKLIEVIGEGGHGVVFRAEQEQPVRRFVALKVIKKGLESVSAKARFETERQTLALMDHPNIAKLFDAGTTDQGRPYYVMEIVPGAPMTHFCDQQRLSIRRRVELFISICRAIHHAHQRGIIHGDLKPTNVMVMASDGVISPKVIDFGVSRLQSRSHTLSDRDEILGTPQYMSPEQAADDPVIDIRSDVYALGAMLYELLTGCVAITAASGDIHTLKELRVALIQGPNLPSLRAIELVSNGSKKFQLKRIAENRETTPAAFPGLLKEDLDWIVMKAIDRDSSGRYDSVSAMADDLQRYLDHRPVLAAPPDIAYVARRFVDRNKAVVILSLIIIGSVLGSLYVVSLSLVRTRTARDRVVAAEGVIASSEADAIIKLQQSYLEQAINGERSRRPGQRLRSLKAIELAAKIAPSLQLRNQAIACMSLSDTEFVQELDQTKPGTCTILNHDMTRYAISDLTGGVQVFEIAHRRLLYTLRGDGTPINGFMDFSPDGRYLHVGYNSRASVLRIWDLQTRLPVYELKPTPSNQWIRTLWFSHNSRWFAVPGTGDTVELHPLFGAAAVRSFPTGGPVRCVRFSPGDRQLLISGGAAGVRILSLDSGEVRKIPTSISAITNLDWRPDGQQLAIAGDEPIPKIELVNPDTGMLQAEIASGLVGTNSVVYTHDGRFILSQGWQSKLRICDTFSGAEILSQEAYGYTPQISDDDSLLSFNGPRARQIWKLVRSQQCRTVTGIAQDLGIVSTDGSPDGNLLAVATHLGVRIFNLETGSRAAFIACPGPRTVLFDRDGANLRASTAKGVMSWRVSEIQARNDPQPQVVSEGNTSAMAITPDGKKIIFGTSDGTMRAGDPTDMSKSLQIGRHSGPPRFAAISPDGHWAASCRRFDSDFTVWNLATRSTAVNLPLLVPRDETGQVAFSPDGKFLVIAESPAYRWYSVGDWKLVRRLERQHVTTVGLMAFSPDGKLLALSGPELSILLVDPVTGEQLATFNTQIPNFPGTLAFSRDSSQLMVAGLGPSVIIWDVRRIQHELYNLNLNW